MHFNIYVDDQTGQQLTELALQCGQPRNALIREAVRQWLERRDKTERSVDSFAGNGEMHFETGHGQTAFLKRGR